MSGDLSAALAEQERNAIGYCVVAIPDQDFYQGYFIKSDDEASAVETLAKVRALCDTYMPPTATIQPVSGVSDADQPLMGMLSSVLIEFASKGQYEQCAVIAMAITKVSGRKFWWVKGSITQSGTNSTFNDFRLIIKDVGLGMKLPLPVSNPDDARRAIQDEPEIKAINARNQAKMQVTGAHRVH